MWAWSRGKVEVPESVSPTEDECGAVEYEGPIEGEAEDVDRVSKVGTARLDRGVVRDVDEVDPGVVQRRPWRRRHAGGLIPVLTSLWACSSSHYKLDDM